MRLREHPAIGEGRTDILPADPRLLSVVDGYNVRDLTTPEAREELDELKAKVKAHGVRTALVVRFDGEKIWIVEGHKRHKVALELIAEHETSGGAEGRNIDFVPITAEKLGTNDVDRDFGLETSNSGSRLKPLELANLIYRLHTQRGLPLEAIAEGLGKSPAVIKNHLAMRGMSEPIKEHVRAGDISATLASKIAKGVDPEFATKLIEDNLAENRKIKGKRTKVTAKTLKRDKPKAEPKSDPKPKEEQQTAPVVTSPEVLAERTSEQAAIDGAPEIHNDAPTPDLPSALAATPETEIPEGDAEAELIRQRQHEDRPAQPQAPRRLNSKVDELLLEFISVDRVDLAAMYARLCREREEAAGEGAISTTQEQLCVAADVIGVLRFPEEWESAKATSEMKMVA